MTNPGEIATKAYIRRIMADGRWRTSGDIVTKAKTDGMTMTASSVGRYMNILAGEGLVMVDGGKGRQMWKARKKLLEDAR